MSQTTNWTGNAANGTWEDAGNWDNGVPISADDTVIAVITDNGGAGVNGPVAAVTVGGADIELPDQSANPYYEGYVNLTLATGGSLVLIDSLGEGNLWLAVNGDVLENLTVSGGQFGPGTAGGGYSVTGSLLLENGGNGYGGDASSVHGACIASGASLFTSGIVGDNAVFDGGSNSGASGAFTSFVNGAWNAGTTGAHATYDSGSFDQGIDGDDVIFNGDSYCYSGSPSGSVTFNASSSLTGGNFVGNIAWNSDGVFESDNSGITLGGLTITASAPLTINATSNQIQPPAVIVKDLLDVTIELLDSGGTFNLGNGVTIQDAAASGGAAAAAEINAARTASLSTGFFRM